ncbi:protein SMG7 isoform X1 [Pistacia vera]|uniref:protein SMG7 isoform X1 n=2 Tax=Pistacia vera TaxID=55513 RepID=UPI0012637F21|nr:protein SMG7 isoform X1 [Pistacia vera]
MMIVQMDKMSAPSSRERVQRLYEKNIELENKRRKSAQARVPSDPNAWQQMRENYETIILEDYAFSEQHNIEFALWQLHYKRIEELRGHYSAAITATNSNTSQGVKVPARPDRVTKIRLQFKTFLSEATGFYHELILKIRAKYGLPLGYFSEDSENRITMDKDGKKLAEVKKGLVSCHRCLIYLGDLARYKGLYGEGDSKSREYAAASSYYLQSASLVPSSGNPHHQLAILASYSGDELAVVYRYFRSLAVDTPCTTARDNLIVLFEKNRQIYSQMSGDVKLSTAKEHQRKGRGKGEAKLASKETDMEASSVKESVPSVQEKLKSFCTRFVRLNGILFTRTSLETFAEVLAFVSSGLCELLSSGPEEKLSFGSDAAENAVFIVRLISILIFTVHNLKKEAENQSYAEIVQRAALLQNAFTAVFELMGHVIERCIQLRDPSSSCLLPGVLVFVEWLACCPEIAAGSDDDERQAAVRKHFWNQCISFLNKILSLGPMSMDDDEDMTCFFNMSRYDEGETENRLALWEDFELRGFLPLLPAQTILDFSRKHSFGGDGNKERKARLKRILAAGKALANVVTVDQKTICFDSRVKKFVVGVEPSDDVTFSSYPDMSKSNDMLQENQTEKKMNLGVVHPNPQVYVDGEEEDEVIVFKPVVTEKRADVIGSNWMSFDGLKPGHSASAGNLQLYGGPVSAPIDNIRQPATFDNSSQIPVSVASILPQQLQPFQLHASNRLMEEEASLANSFKGLRVSENGHVVKHDLQENIGVSLPAVGLVPIQQSVNAGTSSLFYSHLKGPEVMIPPKIDAVASSGITFDSLAVKASSALPAGQRKNPVSRPVRHLGPPPGFSSVPSKQVTAPISGSDLTGENALMDDYSWLDGYQLPSSTRGLGSSINYPSHSNPQYIGNSNGVTGTVSFPFPGKQAPAMQFQVEKQIGWQDFQTLDHLKLQHEQQLQLQQQQQQLGNGNQQFAPLPEQYQGQSIWAGRYFV